MQAFVPGCEVSDPLGYVCPGVRFLICFRVHIPGCKVSDLIVGVYVPGREGHDGFVGIYCEVSDLFRSEFQQVMYLNSF